MNASITAGVTSPAQSAVDVSVSSKITVSFTVGAGTFDVATVTAACAGNSIPGTTAVTTTASGGQVVFTPSTALPYASNCSVQELLTAKGANGGLPATANVNLTFQTEARPVLRYTDVVYANAFAGGWYPHRFILKQDGTFSVEKAINKTKYTGGALPLANCLYKKGVLPDGGFAWNCQDAASLARHDLVVNPLTNELSEYDGAFGALPSISDSVWVDVQPADSPNPTWSSYAETSKGWFFNERTTTRTQMYQDKTTGAVTEVTRAIDAVKAYVTISN